ncbi:heavy metal translocating P-type ATPase [Bariatricus massiliensis]|uniref:Cd(2+)-exporting ATPase n=1 Tax=Bariatricus massiliensis TaxID=1745713 RepID=A0ABS8DLV6_9FIRM|nr:heavy metal translocating P-type ATPase [Bariatricus massiliensis]MCB7306006.1 cadmium-translocating P-type ATPase [Bariatricus massiliensis]MCB7374698.1 cadmium-translocating P-type ATPase [Bariatricus massiliensis]MCB7389149.1 cadmium-translocating P-type ATPase [Bariatricus massiliensis]MCB7413322.1 cadmium-translocating P-type ATPase [Bariatricus massiliensis]MCQ5255216.1 heavy metal translocating P-type ATPase [Bariatricus massiliensis]
MTKKQKTMLYRIILAAIVYIPLFVMDHKEMLEFDTQVPVRFLLFMIPYVIIGWDIIYRAIRNISHGQVFDENFLMCIATFGAIGVKQYSESVAVMLFYQVGELFQSYAVSRSRQSISDMMDICPEYANIEQDGQLVQVDPDEINIGDIIVIKAGERIPLDGVVISGSSFIDTSALTGESVPREVGEGSDIISGCVNGSGLLKVRVTKEFEDSTVAKILELVENASSKKAKVENFITKFAKYYTPIVVCAAALLAVIPPLLIGEPFSKWVARACIFLVISCPCALVISVPLGFFGGIGAASRQGVLVKGSNYLEVMSEMKTIVFDKTGTLTKGEFTVSKLYPNGVGEKELLEIAALAEGYSAHPVAGALKAAYKKELEMERVTDTQEIPGHGIKATVDGATVYAGNAKLMEKEGIWFEENHDIGTVVYLAKEDLYLGSIVISDTVKPEAKNAIKELKENGVTKTVMLTGDRKAVGEAVAKELGIDQVYTDLLPGDKVDKVEALLEEVKGKGRLGFVGDGINDAPVLTRADIGIAMGSMGSDAAIEAADIVLMDDDTTKISHTMRIARMTLQIVKQNIVFALAVKVLVLLLGAIGMANMWEAVFADVGVSVIAILNAMRTLRAK